MRNWIVYFPWWLKTTQIYFFAVLEIRNLKPRHQQGYVPSETLGRILPCPLLSFWELLAISGTPWFASLKSCLCCHMAFFLYVSVLVFTWHSSFHVSVYKFPSSYKDSSHWIRAHLKPVWSHRLYLKRPYFQIKSQELGVRTWTYLLGEYNSDHYR